METFLPTAYSSHHICMICRERKCKMHRVNKRDIITAYTIHGIYIKYGSVICDAHWNDVGLIRDEEFFRIEAKERSHNSACIHRLMND